MEDRLNGVITKIDSIKTRGFGFIKSNKYAKIFFHISDVENRKYDFSIGERLEFNILKSNKGYRAVNIIRLDMAEYEKIIKYFEVGDLSYFDNNWLLDERYKIILLRCINTLFENSDYVLNKNIFDNSPLIIYLFYNKDKLNNSFFRDEKFRIILEKYGYTFDNELKIAKSRNKHILINGMAGTGKTTLMDREAASGNLLIKLSHGEKGTGSTIFQVLKYALEYKIGKENEDFIKFIFYMKLLYHPEDIKERTELYKLFKDYYTYKDFEVIINDVYVFDKYKETPKFRWYRLSKNYVTKTIDYTFIGSILYEVEIKDIYTNFIEKMLVDKEDYDSIKDTGEFLLCVFANLGKLIFKNKTKLREMMKAHYINIISMNKTKVGFNKNIFDNLIKTKDVESVFNWLKKYYTRIPNYLFSKHSIVEHLKEITSLEGISNNSLEKVKKYDLELTEILAELNMDKVLAGCIDKGTLFKEVLFDLYLNGYFGINFPRGLKILVDDGHNFSTYEWKVLSKMINDAGASIVTYDFNGYMYEFVNANEDNINNYIQKFKPDVINMNINYRSSQYIVKELNNHIRRSPTSLRLNSASFDSKLYQEFLKIEDLLETYKDNKICFVFRDRTSLDEFQVELKNKGYNYILIDRLFFNTIEGDKYRYLLKFISSKKPEKKFEKVTMELFPKLSLLGSMETIRNYTASEIINFRILNDDFRLYSIANFLLRETGERRLGLAIGKFLDNEERYPYYDTYYHKLVEDNKVNIYISTFHRLKQISEFDFTIFKDFKVKQEDRNLKYIAISKANHGFGYFNDSELIKLYRSVKHQIKKDNI